MTTTAEVQVIGAMLNNPVAIDEVSEIITGTDYADARHELIHDTIVTLAASGRPVDPLSVADTLAETKGDLERIGGTLYLHECATACVTAASAAYHAGIVRAASMRRRVATTGHRLSQIAQVDGDPLEVVNEAREQLDDLIADRDTGINNEQAAYAALEALDAPLGIKTPWGKLSRIISGWAPGMLYIAGARPGIGKTSIGVASALDVAHRGKTALFFSMEMPHQELYLRMYSAIESVDGESIQHRNLSKDEHAKLGKAATHVASLPLIVDDRSNLSIAQIRAKVRATQRKTDLGLVVVDYLGLVKPPAGAPKNDRRVQVDAIAQGLKNLARDTRVPILALAQLNRGIEGRADKVPTLADLRESGGIEAAADVAMLMHRDTQEAPADLQIVIAKNRHGPMATISLVFEGAYSRITEPQFAHLRSI